MYIANFLRLTKLFCNGNNAALVVQVLFGKKVILQTIQTCTGLFILLQNVHFMSVTDNYTEPVAENTEPVSKASLSHSIADT
jgi:hypothetical protein